jgi:rare lipoprotein A
MRADGGFQPAYPQHYPSLDRQPRQINPLFPNPEIAGAATKGNYHVGQVMDGVASVYWEGSQTANGERFHPNNHHDLTIAHKGLPFNTRVKITAANGRQVVARVNDRGPFIRGREFDLSRATAQELGVGGLSQVSVEIVGFA